MFAWCFSDLCVSLTVLCVYAVQCIDVFCILPWLDWIRFFLFQSKRICSIFGFDPSSVSYVKILQVEIFHQAIWSFTLFIWLVRRSWFHFYSATPWKLFELLSENVCGCGWFLKGKRLKSDTDSFRLKNSISRAPPSLLSFLSFAVFFTYLSVQ